MEDSNGFKRRRVHYKHNPSNSINLLISDIGPQKKIPRKKAIDQAEMKLKTSYNSLKLNYLRFQAEIDMMDQLFS